MKAVSRFGHSNYYNTRQRFCQGVQPLLPRKMAGVVSAVICQKSHDLSGQKKAAPTIMAAPKSNQISKVLFEQEDTLSIISAEENVSGFKIGRMRSDR